MKILPWAIAAVLAYLLYRQSQPQIQQAATFGAVDVNLHKTAFDIVGLIQSIKDAAASPPTVTTY